MNKETIIVFCVLFIFVILLSLFAWYKKKRILKMLTDKYGKPSTRNYDERDFMHISQLLRLFPSKGKYTVDDITWHDLQMPILYKQMNHSISHIGDEYLYRHIRTQQYDKLNRLEKHIQYFDAHPEERLKLQYSFYNINPETRARQAANQKVSSNYFAHLKDTDLFPKISVVPSAVILILAVLSCFLLLLLPSEDGTGVLAMTFVFMGSIFYFSHFIRKTGSFVLTLKTFTASVNTSGQIARLESKIFDKELQTLIPALKKLQKKARLMNILVNICMMQNSTTTILSFIAIYFGLYGFVYQWVAGIIKKNTEEAMIFYELIGYIELCICQSSYRKTLLHYCHPVFSDNTQLEFVGLYHPLLQKPVTNSKSVNQRFIITGANASGKSTFAKTLAINAITAQTINICYAEKFSLHPACIYTSMNLNDDITTGDSFYMAEIKRLKSFLDSLATDSYKMFFADEILKGTNTTERIAAASAILKRFAESNCFICLTTHDIELTSILHHYYANYHFKEITTDTEICYDYKLHDGVTPASNAIALLKFSRYDPAIVDEASKSARHFINNSEWEIITPQRKV